MADRIPIFDTLSHPTLNGDWILPNYAQRATISSMKINMREAGVYRAFAVGMAGIGGYEEQAYLNMIRYEGEGMFLPVAFFDFTNLNHKQIRERLIAIKRMGYVGIKLHPRFSNFLIKDDRLPYIIDTANDLDLIPLFCTFFYSNRQPMSVNNIDSLGDMLMKLNSDSDIILLHGGLTRVLETMELVRYFPCAKLDLSETLAKYEGTHIEMDFDYIFRLFDRKTTIGTDSPEISHHTLRMRFEKFAANTTIEKAENIAYKNIENVLTKHNISF